MLTYYATTVKEWQQVNKNKDFNTHKPQLNHGRTTKGSRGKRGNMRGLRYWGRTKLTI